MDGLLNKAKTAAQGYKDQETGKTGYAGIAAEGQEAFKRYNEDKKDGTTDWKKEGTDLFNQVKGGLGGASKPAGDAAAPPK